VLHRSLPESNLIKYQKNRHLILNILLIFCFMSHFNVSLARGLGTMTSPANTIADDDNVEHAASATTTTDDSSADWQPGVEADSNSKLMLNADGGWRMPSQAHTAAMDTIVPNL